MTDIIDKENYDGKERRCFPRVNAFVSYQILDKETAEKISCSKNISAGGISFFAKKSVKIDEVLLLSISLPDHTDLIAKGKVIWAEPVSVSWDPEIFYELGVTFVEITEDDRKKIAKYVFLRLDQGCS
ncbi:MAG: PilZ domain-containing protein [PVC group bacterium]|nr:PilZ domain-containing protein [PVC group bacterium]